MLIFLYRYVGTRYLLTSIINTNFFLNPWNLKLCVNQNHYKSLKNVQLKYISNFYDTVTTDTQNKYTHFFHTYNLNKCSKILCCGKIFKSASSRDGRSFNSFFNILSSNIGLSCFSILSLFRVIMSEMFFTKPRLFIFIALAINWFIPRLISSSDNCLYFIPFILICEKNHKHTMTLKLNRSRLVVNDIWI